MDTTGSENVRRGLLNKAEIVKELAASRIFKEGSYDKDNLRAAAYDLRIARDFLITPDGRKFGPGQKEREYKGRRLVLKPGEIAFVVTREKIALPWSMAATIAPKFEMMRRGIFILHGSLVDPGYGMQAGSDAAKEDERLHFVITNLGPKKCVIQPGDERIAALQFFRIDKVPGHEQIDIPGVASVWEEMINESRRLKSGLAFFDNTTKNTKILKRRVEQIDTTNERVVAFGVYVLAAALLTIVMTVLVAILSGAHRVAKINIMISGQFHWYTYVFLAVVLAVAVVFGACLALFANSMRALGRNAFN